MTSGFSSKAPTTVEEMREFLSAGRTVFVIYKADAVGDGHRMLRRVLLNCFSRGEVPVTLRGVYSLALDIADERERRMALVASDAWMIRAGRVACYLDGGVDADMRTDLEMARDLQLPIEFRRVVGPRISSEALHFQNVPHSPGDCAVCLGPLRVAELRAEQEAQRARAHNGEKENGNEE